MKRVTVEEFQVTLLVRSDLGKPEVRMVRRALAGNQFVRVLRRAIERLIGENTALNDVTIRIFR